MLGGSLLVTLQAAQQVSPNLSVVTIDSFTGDVNMACWERELALNNRWRFLGIREGRITIYERFLANVAASPWARQVTPIVSTSLVGMKTLLRLHRERRLSTLPDVIILDTAHEEDETFLELKVAWSILPSGGCLCGDDLSWPGVNVDLKRFVGERGASVPQPPIFDETRAKTFASMVPEGHVVENRVAVSEALWAIFKT